MTSLARALFAEALGTCVLLATVVGSGIMGVALSDGNDGVALLANSGATAAVLYVLIVVLGPLSGAHFNPAVTLAMRLRGAIDTRTAAAFVCPSTAPPTRGRETACSSTHPSTCIASVPSTGP